MAHKLVATVTAHSDRLAGPVDLKEVECKGQYVVMEVGANYCPRCGDELE